ncbi:MULTISPECIES: hypothetical protein [Agrobacterium]|uniref:hypothetical protein n=1 Tax=Agrobacterium TaxID=357 RepID=UPI001FD88F46|nr:MULTISPECIES: hypothetical protein [Agrobacterium]
MLEKQRRRRPTSNFRATGVSRTFFSVAESQACRFSQRAFPMAMSDMKRCFDDEQADKKSGMEMEPVFIAPQRPRGYLRHHDRAAAAGLYHFAGAAF